MARKPKKVTPESAGVKVSRVAVSARRLVTLDEGHGIWTGKKNVLAFGPKEFWDGAIVRLRPPTEVEDGRVEDVKKALAAAGVARIKLEVRKGVVLPTEALEKAKPARCTAREVVLLLVAESNSVDAPALMEICERVMSAEGL